MEEIRALGIAYGPFITAGWLALSCVCAVAGLERGKTLWWSLAGTAGLLFHALLCQAQWQVSCTAEGTIAPMLRTLTCLGVGLFFYLLLLAAAAVYVVCALLERAGKREPR